LEFRICHNKEPSCLINFWMQETTKELADATAAGSSPPEHSSNLNIGSYLFAAQDASTSSLLWASLLAPRLSFDF
jgi:cytochrome P450 family 710 subfamily A protein